MIRLTSNLTLFFKLALPVFVVVLYGMITIYLLFVDVVPFGNYEWVRLSNLICYLAVVYILFKTVFQLYRVDCGEEHFIVTNYRSAYKYSYDSIDSFKMDKFLFITLGVIKFQSPSSFGASISFLIDLSNYNKIEEKYGDVFAENPDRPSDAEVKSNGSPDRV